LGRMRPRTAPSRIDDMARERRQMIGLGFVFLWFLVGGIAHFAATNLEIRIMPSYIPWPRAAVLVSGACELLGATSLLYRPTRRAAATGPKADTPAARLRLGPNRSVGIISSDFPPRDPHSKSMRNVDTAIGQFCSYFEREIGEISRLVATYGDGATEPSAASGPLYRKVLYVSMLDTLAGIRFHHKAFPELSRQSRTRFSRFVEAHCSWPDTRHR